MSVRRSAREAEDLIKQAVDKGENLPKEDRFDSNCITPGKRFVNRFFIILESDA